MVFLLVFLMAARTPIDSDLWWHLRAGEESWLTHSPVTIDRMSFTQAGDRWINHSWLAQIAFYLIYKNIGYFGLGGFVALIVAVSMTLLYFQMEGNPITKGFLIAFGCTVAAPVWSPRPQVISLLLFTLLMYLGYLYKWKKKDYFWLVIPLFVLWSNIHGGYVLGVIYLSLFVMGELINIGNTDEPKLSQSEIVRLFAFSIAALAVVIVNPNNFSMWSVPFKTIEIGVLSESIDEWLSPDFHEITQQPLIWLLIVVIGSIGFSRKKLDGSDFMLTAGFLYLALLARRNFAPFALITLPIIARHISVLGNELKYGRLKFLGAREKSSYIDRMTNSQFSPKVKIFLNSTLLILLFCACLLKLGMATSGQIIEKFKTQLYPVEAVRWIEENQPEGNIFNSYNWGGYLTWELRKYPVFVDGRTDLFGDEVLDIYSRVITGDEGWDKNLDDYSIDLILIEREAGLTDAIVGDPNWEMVYGDNIAVVYTRAD
jgi:hypothetical protein